MKKERRQKKRSRWGWKKNGANDDKRIKVMTTIGRKNDECVKDTGASGCKWWGVTKEKAGRKVSESWEEEGERNGSMNRAIRRPTAAINILAARTQPKNEGWSEVGVRVVGITTNVL